MPSVRVARSKNIRSAKFMLNFLKNIENNLFNINLVVFAQIFPKQTLKCTLFFNFQKMAKWPNHFISDKQFQKGQMATLQIVSACLEILIHFPFSIVQNGTGQ